MSIKDIVWLLVAITMAVGLAVGGCHVLMLLHATPQQAHSGKVQDKINKEQHELEDCDYAEFCDRFNRLHPHGNN